MFGLGIWELIAISFIGLVLVLIIKGVDSSSESRTTTCRDCDGLVSKSAKKCPHCGADNPHLDKAGFGFLTFIRVIILLGVLFVSILLFLFALDLMELSNRLKY